MEKNAIQIKVSVHDWLLLPMLTRVKLREIFKIPRSRGSQVEMGQGPSIVKSDGTTEQDLLAITTEKMQGFLGNESENFVELFNLTIEKIEEADKEMEPISKPDANQIMLEHWAADLGRMEQQAKAYNLVEAFQLLISKFNGPTNQSVSTAPLPGSELAPEKAVAKGTKKGSPKAKKNR